MEWLLIGAAVVVALLLITGLARRGVRGDEVEQFHRARSMTTGWARSAGASIEEPTPYPDVAEPGSGAAQDDDPGAGFAEDQGPTVRHGRDRSSAT